MKLNFACIYNKFKMQNPRLLFNILAIFNSYSFDVNLVPLFI